MWELNTKKYFLNVIALDPMTNGSVTLKGALRVFGHQEKYFCSLNMINIGTGPIPQGGSLEFISVGMAKEFTCKIDNEPMKPCKLIFGMTMIQ